MLLYCAQTPRIWDSLIGICRLTPTYSRFQGQLLPHLEQSKIHEHCIFKKCQINKSKLYVIFISYRYIHISIISPDTSWPSTLGSVGSQEKRHLGPVGGVSWENKKSNNKTCCNHTHCDTPFWYSHTCINASDLHSPGTWCITADRQNFSSCFSPQQV